MPVTAGVVAGTALELRKLSYPAPTVQVWRTEGNRGVPGWRADPVRALRRWRRGTRAIWSSSPTSGPRTRTWPASTRGRPRRSPSWPGAGPSSGTPTSGRGAVRVPTRGRRGRLALADVAEDFVSELAVVRRCSETEASRLAVESLLLTAKLAPTWSELCAGGSPSARRGSCSTCSASLRRGGRRGAGEGAARARRTASRRGWPTGSATTCTGRCRRQGAASPGGRAEGRRARRADRRRPGPAGHRGAAARRCTPPATRSTSTPAGCGPTATPADGRAALVDRAGPDPAAVGHPPSAGDRAAAPSTRRSPPCGPTHPPTPHRRSWTGSWSPLPSAASSWPTSTCSASGPRRPAARSPSRSTTRSPARRSPSPPAPSSARRPAAAPPPRRAAGPGHGARQPTGRRAGLRPAAHPTGLPPHRRSTPPRHHPRPALPDARLPPPRRPLRHRPRPPVRRRRTNRLREPLLPVPATPPHQDLRPRLDLHPAARRTTGRPHPVRRLPHHPPTRLGPRPRTRPTLARRDRPTGPAAARRRWRASS